MSGTVAQATQAAIDRANEWPENFGDNMFNPDIGNMFSGTTHEYRLKCG